MSGLLPSNQLKQDQGSGKFNLILIKANTTAILSRCLASDMWTVSCMCVHTYY